MPLYQLRNPSHRVTDNDIKLLFDEQQDAMRLTRRKAENADRLLHSENLIQVHKNLEKLGIRRPTRLPTPRTATQRILQVLTEKHPRIRRFWTGLAKTAQEMATEIEQPIDAIMRAKNMYPRFHVAGLLLVESWAAVSCIPAPADWLRTPVLLDAEGKIAKQWRRKGDASDDEAHERYETTKQGHLIRHIPLRMTAHSIQNTGPIFGPNGKLVGLVEKKSLNSVMAVQAGYRWGEGYLMQESNEVLNKAGDVDFYTGVFTGADGHVYLSYSIDGLPTCREDLGPNAAVIDLTEKYGIERAPIASEWGLGWPSHDPDRRGMTFTEPFENAWESAEVMLTYMVAACMWLGMPPLFEEESLGGTGGDTEPTTTLIEPGAIHRSAGKITQLQVQPFHPALVQTIQMLMGANEAELPSKQGLGGGGDNAIAQTVSRAFAEDALGSVRRADLSLYEQTASFAWEQSVCLGRKFRPVLVLANIDTLVPQTGRQSSTQSVLTIDPDIVPDDLSTADWDLHAELVGDPSDNMPLIMMLAELNDRGKYPLEDLLERMGFTSPEQVVAKIEAEKLRQLPAYQAMQLQRVAMVAGNDEEAEFYRLQAEQLMAEVIGINGQAVIGPDGKPVRLPTGVGQGLTQFGGGMSGTQGAGGAGGGPAQQSLAAHVGGAIGGGATARRTGEAGGTMPSAAAPTSLAA